jgi:hypothetical protein
VAAENGNSIQLPFRNLPVIPDVFVDENLKNLFVAVVTLF